MIAMERNEDNLANNNAAVSSDDEDDPLDEGEARLRSIKFLKQNKGSSADDDDDDDNNNGEEKHVKRYDEMSSFLSRSERTLSLPDMPPSEEELAQRRVKIVEQAKEVHNVEPMSAEEARAYYMNDEDFRRVDIDVELTTMRWEKAQKVGFCSCSCWRELRRCLCMVLFTYDVSCLSFTHAEQGNKVWRNRKSYPWVGGNARHAQASRNAAKETPQSCFGRNGSTKDVE